MINFIYGKVINKDTNKILLNTNNLGFEINILSRDNFILLNEYNIHVFCHINKDFEISYYGFLNKQDYKMFKKLISIQGIGCKSAQNILNVLSSDDLITIIREENFTLLRQLIGCKANNIILTLKKEINKIPDIFMYEGVYLTLKNLGYKQDSIKKALTKLNSDLDEEEALKQALKIINYV